MSSLPTKQNNKAILKAKTAEVVRNYLEKNREPIMRSLPRGFNYDRMCRTAINAISTTPAIAACTPASLFLGIVKAFTLGLEPNGALSEGYLVPFQNKGVSEAVFMPSYRGLINLARRSGEISTVYARAIHENDKFELDEGLNRKLVHVPNVFGDRGKVLGYYAVFTTKSGDSDFEVMNKAEIDKIRNVSKAKNAMAWTDWYDEMAKKTVIRRLMKRAPMSIELAGAIEQETRVDTGEGAIIDIEGMEVPEEPTSSFEEKPADNGKQPEDKAEAKEKTLDELLANAPVTKKDIHEFCLANGKKFDEKEIIKNLKTTVNQVADWRDNLGK